VRYLAAAAVLLLAGCVTARVHDARRKNYDEMMAFIGQPKDALVQSRGTPSACDALDAGGEACTWSQFASVSGSNAALYGHGRHIYGGGSSYGVAGERRVIVTFDKDHAARHWTIRPANGDAYSDATSRDSL
jgi:hypothetical protein